MLPGDRIRERASRVFVTGGTGFLGSHLVRRLAGAGLEPTLLCLPGDRAPLLDGVAFRRVDGDLADEDALARAMEGHDLAFHLAAIYALWMPRPETIWRVNVEGTRRVTAAARRAGVPRVVHTSSIAAVGTLPGEGVADETTGFCDWAIADDYVLSKYVSELEALRASRDGLEVVAVNPAFPFGHGDLGPTPTGRLVQAGIQGKMPFWAEGGFNAVDARDVAEGHLLAAVSGRPGERYILGGENLTYKEFGERVAKVAGTKPARFKASTAVLRKVGLAYEQVARLTGRPPLMTPRSVEYTVGRHLWYSSDKAKRELGYAPRPLDEAIRASVEWFRSGAGRR